MHRQTSSQAMNLPSTKSGSAVCIHVCHLRSNTPSAADPLRHVDDFPVPVALVFGPDFTTLDPSINPLLCFRRSVSISGTPSYATGFKGTITKTFQNQNFKMRDIDILLVAYAIERIPPGDNSEFEFEFLVISHSSLQA